MNNSDYVKECIDKLKDAQCMDEEAGHIQADDAIKQFLINVGYGDVAFEYGLVEKWYS